MCSNIIADVFLEVNEAGGGGGMKYQLACLSNLACL